MALLAAKTADTVNTVFSVAIFVLACIVLPVIITMACTINAKMDKKENAVKAGTEPEADGSAEAVGTAEASADAEAENSAKK